MRGCRGGGRVCRSRRQHNTASAGRRRRRGRHDSRRRSRHLELRRARSRSRRRRCSRRPGVAAARVAAPPPGGPAAAGVPAGLRGVPPDGPQPPPASTAAAGAAAWAVLRRNACLLGRYFSPQSLQGDARDLAPAALKTSYLALHALARCALRRLQARDVCPGLWRRTSAWQRRLRSRAAGVGQLRELWGLGQTRRRRSRSVRAPLGRHRLRSGGVRVSRKVPQADLYTRPWPAGSIARKSAAGALSLVKTRTMTEPKRQA